MNRIIADSGVIAAFLVQHDQWHRSVFTRFMELPKPFLTCEAVVTEACYLVRRSKGGETAVLDFVANDILKIDFSISDEIEKVISLMKKYADIPMSFADACLLRMCELGQDVELFTLDSDFGIYRMHGRYQVPVVTG